MLLLSTSFLSIPQLSVMNQFLTLVGIQNKGLVQFGNATEFYSVFGLHPIS